MVGSGGLEQVEVNGQEAIFIRGGWFTNIKSWNPDINREVRQVLDDLTYKLSTGGQFACPNEPEKRCPLSDEELMRIAESVD